MQRCPGGGGGLRPSPQAVAGVTKKRCFRHWVLVSNVVAAGVHPDLAAGGRRGEGGRTRRRVGESGRWEVSHTLG